MSLREYFSTAKGTGFLATANAQGNVNIAVYARPHFLGEDDHEAAFIMNDRLSHAYVDSNPHAAYLFMEASEDYVGKRLILTKVREETDAAKIRSLRRRNLPPECEGEDSAKRFLVYFRVDDVRPLIGAG
ncbi:MAG: pyridoxamine 5'-phosphate oxidase family protein [Planctomycetes bacterium]|nr:pyridoxamine 5'-phosphate oxidase family protein [Planctomycetota bacterium]